MGYELSKFMKQYGIATPTLAAAPVSPADGASQAEIDTYNTNKALYDQYVANYQNRIASTPQYGEKQYSTVFAPVSSRPVQEYQSNAMAQTAPPQMVQSPYNAIPTENIIRNAYQQMGRQGFGPGANQIDIPGYQYWMDEAAKNNYTPEQLNSQILDAANANYTSQPTQTTSTQISDIAKKYDIETQDTDGSSDVLQSPTYVTAADSGAAVNSGATTGSDVTAANNDELEKFLASAPSGYYGTYFAGSGGGESDGSGSSHGEILSLEDIRKSGKMPTIQGGGEGRFFEEIYGAGGDAGGSYFKPYEEPSSSSWYAGDSGAAHGGLIPEALKKKYALGGVVKGYEEGGDVEPEQYTYTAEDTAPAPATAPAAPTPAPAAPDRSAVLERMLQAYGPQKSYTGEVAAARQRAQAESEAFNNLISRHLESPESAQQSKAEMYFRLAAAFGAPTRTGNFSENLGMVGQQLAQHSRGLRESAAGKRDLMLKAQQLKMGAAKEDLAAVRALEAESMKERRAINMEMIKEYIKSGQPESNAGKIAKDMGLTPGTPEYLAKIKELTDLDVQRKVGEIDAKIKGLELAGQNAELREQLANRLSPKEIEMKSTLEDQVATGQQALADLKQAYSLNSNSFEGGWLDKAQRAALEAAGSKDPKVVNTRVMENLLGAQGLAKLKATFGGAPTEGERQILMELEGIGAKTRDERAAIMKRTYSVLAERIKREQKRLQDISTGRYRMTEPAGGIE